MKDCSLPISKAQVDEFLFPLYQIPEPTSDDLPFEPSDVEKMLGGASTQVQAMILLALNGCLDNVDVSRIEWGHIDLTRKTVSYPRKKPSWKTTRPRRFRLWDRTVAALEAVEPSLPRREGRVFSTHHGQEWVRPQKDSIIQEITKIKSATGVEHPGNFRNFRKSALTAAAIAGVSEVTVEMLLGHSNNKVWRRYAGVVPPAVEDAVKEIEAHFFPPPKPAEEAKEKPDDAARPASGTTSPEDLAKADEEA
jgi:integrase